MKRKPVYGSDDIDSEIKSPSIQMNPNVRSPFACTYKYCIIAQNKDLETVIQIKQKQNRLDDRA